MQKPSPKGNEGTSQASALFGRAAALSLFLLLAAAVSCRSSPDYELLLVGSWERSASEKGYSFRGSLELRPDGTFSFTFEGDAPGHSDSHGKWSLSGRDITFLDNSCADPGTYRFLLKRDKLSFLPLREDCGLRKNALTGDWEKKTDEK
jgi:hypothetical protein